MTMLQAMFDDPSILTTTLQEEGGFEYELENGLMANTVADLTESEVTFRTQYKAGEGQTPYAESPQEHERLLNTPSVVNTEGKVMYEAADDGGEPLSLPKFIYFEEAVAFTEPVTTTEDLEEELEAILGHTVTLRE